MMGFVRFPIFDVRLLAVIAIALIAVIILSGPEPAQKPAHLRLSRGFRDVEATSLALSPTGALIATTNTGGRLALRAREEDWQIERMLDYPGFARAAAFSPDGRSLAAVGFGPGICLWDLSSASSAPRTTMAVPFPQPRCLTFSPDGRSLAVATEVDGTILIIDLETRRQRLVLHHRAPAVGVAFSPDGLLLATVGAGRDRLIALWDLQSGSRQTLLEDGPGPDTALAFSDDGALLATAGFPEHHVRLWDIKTGRVRRVFAGHARPVNSVAFSPDGTLLATAGNDGMLGLWNVATGRRWASVNAEATALRTIAFTADGQTLVLATDDDDDLRLWDIAEVLAGARPRRSSQIQDNGQSNGP
jgi:WD40 repeat protein